MISASRATQQGSVNSILYGRNAHVVRTAGSLLGNHEQRPGVAVNVDQQTSCAMKLHCAVCRVFPVQLVELPTLELRFSMDETLQTVSAFSGNSDAEFLATVDQLLEPQDEKELVEERRRSTRFVYLTTAMIAYCSEDQMPSIDQFQKYNCRDISRGGFGFRSETKPESDFLVAAFRLAKDSLTVHSRVVQCHEVEVEQRRLFCIGCKFLRKVDFQSNSSSTDNTLLSAT